MERFQRLVFLSGAHKSVPDERQTDDSVLGRRNGMKNRKKLQKMRATIFRSNDRCDAQTFFKFSTRPKKRGLFKIFRAPK
jgi:hypothetical protein